MPKAKDDPVDDLYGAPLEEFVGRRDALAKELRSGGDREGAAAVKKLPKPTRAAWALNRLVRDRPDEVRALIDAGAALEGAQQQLLEGADRQVLRGAAEAARRLVEALAAEADADGATQDKVRATLHAATVDPEVRAQLAEGRVVKERAAAGFGGLDLMPEAGPAPAKTTKKPKGRAKGGGRAAAAKTPPAPPPPPPPKPKGPTKAQRDALRRANEAEARAERAVDGARRALAQVETTIAARRRDLEAAEAALAEAQTRRERAEAAATPKP